MGSNWHQAKLGDYIDSCLGKMLDQNKNKGNYCKYLGNSNVRWGYFELDELSEMRFESHEYERYEVKKGDLIICEGGEPGRCAIWEEEVQSMKIQKALHRVRTLNGLDSEYLYYWFLYHGRNGRLDAYFTGTTIKHLTGKSLSELPISIPPLSYQKYCAKILRSLDKKITLNRQINQTLEQMAQTLFKSWFVNFDPVLDNALDAGNAIPDSLQERAEQRRAVRAKADFKPLPAETRALFPAEFEETELGWVPKGWEIIPLDKIANFQNGLALQNFRPLNYSDDYLPALKISDLRQGYTSGLEKARVDINESCRVYDGDMIFSWSGTLMIDIWTGGKAALNQHLYKVTSEKYPLSFYLYWTKYHLAIFQHIAAAKAVTMGHINRSDLTNSMCCVPDSCLLEAYDLISGSYIEKLINLRLQNNQLTKVRDSLLPKLISGELSLEALPEVLPAADASI